MNKIPRNIKKPTQTRIWGNLHQTFYFLSIFRWSQRDIQNFRKNVINDINKMAINTNICFFSSYYHLWFPHLFFKSLAWKEIRIWLFLVMTFMLWLCVKCEAKMCKIGREKKIRKLINGSNLNNAVCGDVDIACTMCVAATFVWHRTEPAKLTKYSKNSIPYEVLQ